MLDFTAFRTNVVFSANWANALWTSGIVERWRAFAYCVTSICAGNANEIIQSADCINKSAAWNIYFAISTYNCHSLNPVDQGSSGIVAIPSVRRKFARFFAIGTFIRRIKCNFGRGIQRSERDCEGTFAVCASSGQEFCTKSSVTAKEHCIFKTCGFHLVCYDRSFRGIAAKENGIGFLRSNNSENSSEIGFLRRDGFFNHYFAAQGCKGSTNEFCQTLTVILSIVDQGKFLDAEFFKEVLSGNIG